VLRPVVTAGGDKDHSPAFERSSKQMKSLQINFTNNKMSIWTGSFLQTVGSHFTGIWQAMSGEVAERRRSYRLMWASLPQQWCVLPCKTGLCLFLHSIIHNYYYSLNGVRLSPFGTKANIGLLYQPHMIDDSDCGAIGGMKIGRGSRTTRSKPAPAPLRPPQILHYLTWARTGTAAVGS
jgi:hypothetical protein